jgi:hypothetical protein
MALRSAESCRYLESPSAENGLCSGDRMMRHVRGPAGPMQQTSKGRSSEQQETFGADELDAPEKKYSFRRIAFRRAAEPQRCLATRAASTGGALLPQEPRT